VLPSGQKLTLGLLATITIEIVPFRAYAQFQSSAIFECILEVVFSDGVSHHPRFGLDNLNCVKMAASKFYLQSGKQKSTGLGDDSQVDFGQKSPGDK
jgi:hypothetical protein